MGRAWHVGGAEGGQVRTGILWENLREREKLGRPRMRWEDNIKMIFKNWDGGVDWIYLAQNRDRRWVFVNAVMNLRVP
jgi:hypothetical protein